MTSNEERSLPQHACDGSVGIWQVGLELAADPHGPGSLLSGLFLTQLADLFWSHFSL